VETGGGGTEKNPFVSTQPAAARWHNKVFSCTYFYYYYYYYYFFLKRSFIILFADSPSALSRPSRPKQYKNPFKSPDYNKRYRFCLG